MLQVLEGRVWKFGEEIDTDIICPMSAAKIPDINLMKMHTMEPIRPDWAAQVRPGDIIVAGKNFGCGSSREMAPQMIAALGIQVIIAPSFGRIFFRNAINNGILLIENADVPDACEEGQILTVEVNKAIRVNGRQFPCPSVPENLVDIVEAGGLVNLMKRRNAGKAPASAQPHVPYRTPAAPVPAEELHRYTMVEKILMANTKSGHLKPGDLTVTHPDVVNVHEMNATYMIDMFDEMGFTAPWDPEKIVLYNDHACPIGTSSDPYYYHSTFTLARKLGLPHHHSGEGVAHAHFPEHGYTKPGMVIFATDSHTVSYGAVGAFATGIGYTEMTAIFGSGELWAKVPTAVKIVVEGKLPFGVASKDVVLRVLGDLKADGGNYKALEFTGSAVRDMSVLERHTMCNMVVEIGAKCGICECDEKTAQFCGVAYDEIAWIAPGDDDQYEKVLYYRAEELEPMIACPPYVDNVHPLSEVKGTRLTQVFFGSCTNSSIEDIEIFANIIRGRHFPDRMKVIVSPATIKTYKAAAEHGWLQDIIRAGGIVLHPYCALCGGRGGGLMSDGEVMLGTNNRNFLGRFGANGAKAYLSSPAVAAASALAGQLADPRELV